jgi:glycosyltransferase involved in cell wall biosynthesis
VPQEKIVLNILFVSTKNPYPIADGHGLRTYNLLKHAAKKFNIFLLTFLQTERDLTGLNHMRQFCKDVIPIPIPLKESRAKFYLTMLQSVFSLSPFVVLKYRSHQMQKYIQKIIRVNKIDIVHLDLLPLAQYCKYIRNMPTILVNHNVESILIRRRIKEEKYPSKLFFLLEWLKLSRYESRALKGVSLTIAVSENDRIELQKRSPSAKIEVIDNGVDTEYFRDDGNMEDENTMVYVGGLNWFPNLDAINFFCSDILPLIRERVPNAKLRVVGQLPKKPWRIRHRSVELSGFVEDDRPIISRSAVFIVPLRVGGGTRLKILNALSMGKAVVSTTIGCEGLTVTNEENILIADAPEGFANAVVFLLKSPEIRKYLGRQGRILVKNRYDWQIISSKMNNMYSEILRTKR